MSYLVCWGQWILVDNQTQLKPSPLCTALAELNQTSASVSHVHWYVWCAHPCPQRSNAKSYLLMWRYVMVEDDRPLASFWALRHAVKMMINGMLKGLQVQQKLAQRAPPADSLCDSFPILTSYGANICVYKREMGSKTDKYMSVCTFVLTYSIGVLCKNFDCIFTQRHAFFCLYLCLWKKKKNVNL